MFVGQLAPFTSMMLAAGQADVAEIEASPSRNLGLVAYLGAVAAELLVRGQTAACCSVPIDCVA